MPRDRRSPFGPAPPSANQRFQHGQDVHISRGIRPLLTPFRQLQLAGAMRRSWTPAFFWPVAQSASSLGWREGVVHDAYVVCVCVKLAGAAQSIF
jgi:hypothetical protein